MTEVLLDKKRKIRISLAMLDRFEKGQEQPFQAIMQLAFDSLKADSPDLTFDGVGDLLDADGMANYLKAFHAELKRMESITKQAFNGKKLLSFLQ